jgi:hypothetical protein
MKNPEMFGQSVIAINATLNVRIVSSCHSQVLGNIADLFQKQQ